MLEKLSMSDKRIVGTRRLMKAIAAGEVQEAYLASDADLFIFRQVSDACKNAGVKLIQVDTMKELGEACHVQVRTAAAGIRR